jgi:sugar phosphate permease
VLIVYFLYWFQRSDISTVIPSLISTYHWDPATVGWLNSALIWSYAVMQVPFGYVSERWLGARITVLFGTLLMGVGSVLFGIFLPSIELSIIIRALIGAGSAAILVPANSMLARWFSPSRRGMQTAILFNSGQLAMILASLIMPVLVSGQTRLLGLSSVQSDFLLVGLPVILAVPMVFRFTRNTPEDIGLPPITEQLSEARKVECNEESTGYVLKHSSSPYILTLVYAGATGGFSISAWLTLYFVKVYNMDNVTAAFLFTMVATVPPLLGQPLAGFVGDRIGHRKVVVYSLLGSFLIMALVTSLIALFGTIPLQYIITLLVLFWMFNSGLVNAWPLTTELFTPKVAGTAAGIMNSGGNLVGAIVSVVPGYFIASNPSFIPVFAIGTIVTLMGLVASLFLPSKKQSVGQRKLAPQDQIASVKE